MSTTTQNDWEDLLARSLKGMGLGMSGSQAEWIFDFVRQQRADARKEECRQRLFTIDGLKKTCGICGVIKETAFHKDASQSHDGCENNYNKAIDDVLATLRKESR